MYLSCLKLCTRIMYLSCLRTMHQNHVSLVFNGTMHQIRAIYRYIFISDQIHVSLVFKNHASESCISRVQELCIGIMYLSCSRTMHRNHISLVFKNVTMHQNHVSCVYKRCIRILSLSHCTRIKTFVLGV